MSHSSRTGLCWLGCMLAILSPIMAAEKKNSSDKLQTLLEARIKVLQEIHDLTVSGFKMASTRESYTVERVHSSKAALATARLEMCSSRQERVKTQEAIIKDLEEWREFVEDQTKKGKVAQIDLLKARAFLLDQKIALEIKESH